MTEMPLQWSINHPDQLVAVTMAGSVGPEDAEEFLSAIAAAGAMPYGKIIDLTFAPGELPLAQLKIIMRSTEHYAKTYTLGPLAIVVDCDLSEDTGAFYGERTKVARSFAVFREMSEAMAWLGHKEHQDDDAGIKPRAAD